MNIEAKHSSRKIRVLIVDDSALIRNIYREVINSFPDMEVVGAVTNPLQAREMIKALAPDVLTLDIEMPEMDGLTFLEELMRLQPMPVLMISTFTERGSEQTLRALELGAVDFLAKPKSGVVEGMRAYADLIAEKIRLAARAKVRRATPSTVPARSLPSMGGHLGSAEKLIIVGASTGGTEALKKLLVPMPADAPAVLVAQHMPESFTKSFAARLDGLCLMTVKEGVHHERILAGHVYIAPGHSHMMVKRSGLNYAIELSQSIPVNHHRPSVDKLFHSAAEIVGANAIGVILTGMGKDGAQGMLAMRKAGSYNYAQDEASCVVYGMPRAAVEIGATHEILPVKKIAQCLLTRLLSTPQHR